MPKIFLDIDQYIREFCVGKRTEDPAPGPPRGVVVHGEK